MQSFSRLILISLLVFLFLFMELWQIWPFFIKNSHSFLFNFCAYFRHPTVYSCHVTYGFQSESTLHSYLNVKELLAWSRREIWILYFRFRVYFEQGVPWYSGNYGVWIHFETHTWHDKNIQSVQISTQNIAQSVGQFC